MFIQPPCLTSLAVSPDGTLACSKLRDYASQSPRLAHSRLPQTLLGFLVFAGLRKN
jgi:hypothetical protein